jgi:hypothetical protein
MPERVVLVCSALSAKRHDRFHEQVVSLFWKWAQHVLYAGWARYKRLASLNHALDRVISAGAWWAGLQNRSPVIKLRIDGTAKWVNRTAAMRMDRLRQGRATAAGQRVGAAATRVSGPSSRMKSNRAKLI